MQIILKNVVIAYPQMFEPREFKKGDGRPRWSASFLVAKGSDNDKAVTAAIEAVAKETYGPKWQTMLKSIEGVKQQMCYIDGDRKGEGFEGLMVLSCHRQLKTKAGDNKPPLVIGRDKQAIQDPGKVYSGCVVNARVDVWGQVGENPGMRCSFDVVQYVQDGDPIGQVISTDAFDALEGSEAADFV